MTDPTKEVPEGWHDLRSHLCAWLGDRLIYMAERGRSYPHEMGNDDWRKLLLRHGKGLLEHAELDGAGNATEASFKGAKEALHWAADNLEDLWD